MNGEPLQSVLHPAGADAELIGQFAWVLFGAGALIFIAVLVLLALSLRRHDRPLRPVLWIAGGGVALPVLLLTALLAWSTWRSAQLVPQGSGRAMTISVTGKMWWWEVHYRDPASGREIATANEIRIPVGAMPLRAPVHQQNTSLPRSGIKVNFCPPSMRYGIHTRAI